MATLALTYANLKSAVQDFLGVSAGTNVDDVLNAGYRWFLSGEYPDRRRGVVLYHQWSFLYPWATLTLWPTTQTEKATISGAGNTTLTVDANTFYPSMVGHAIVADTSGTSYTITGYTSAKVLTLSADASADDQDTFTITADGICELPDAFGDLMDPFTYAEGTGLGPLERVSDQRIREAKAGATVTADPYWYALVPRAAHSGYVVETAGTRWDVLFWPTPGSLRTLTYRYKLLVSALDGSTYNYPLGGQEYAQTVLQCCLAKAEQMKRFTVGPQTVQAQADLLAAVQRDAAQGGPRHLGPMVESSDSLPRREWLNTTDVTTPY